MLQLIPAPAGSGSFRPTPVAVPVPGAALLLAVTVNPIDAPAATDGASAVLPAASAGGWELTRMFCVTLLLAVLVSGSGPDTLATMLNVPGVVGVATNVIVAFALRASPPRLHWIGAADVQLPRVDETETRVKEFGMVTAAVAPEAAAGPALVTWIVSVMFVPTEAGLGEKSAATDRSAIEVPVKLTTVLPVTPGTVWGEVA